MSIYIFTAICAVIVLLYFLLPIIIRRNVNSVMSTMKGYKGHIASFHWDIPQIGFYVTGFEITKANGAISTPFIYAEKISNTLDFAAIKEGKFFGITRITDITINFVNGSTEANSQFGKEGNWTKILQDLPNYTINNAEIVNGTIVYYDHLTNPTKAFTISDLSLSVKDLQAKATNKKAHPTHIQLLGSIEHDGKLEVNGSFNAFSPSPDAVLNYKLTEANLTTFNSLTKAYVHSDFEKGILALEGKAKLKGQYVNGYIQIQTKNMKLLSWKKDKDETFFNKIKNGIIQTFVQLTTHPASQTFAVKIPFEGTLDDVKVKLLPSIISIFKKELKIITPVGEKSKLITPKSNSVK